MNSLGSIQIIHDTFWPILEHRQPPPPPHPRRYDFNFLRISFLMVFTLVNCNFSFQNQFKKLFFNGKKSHMTLRLTRSIPLMLFDDPP